MKTAMNRFRSPAKLSFQAMLFVLLVVATGDAGATLRIWPGATPCDTTLQACIQAAAVNDTVQVQSDTPIDEDLGISKPLTLTAAPGYHPVLAAGHGVSVYYGPGAGIGWNFTIDGFGFVDGGFGLRSYSGDAHVTVRHLDIHATAAAYVGGVVGIDNFGTGHLFFTIEDNRIRLDDTTGLQAVAVTSASGSTFQGSVHDNRIESLSPASDTGILISGTQASAPSLLVYSNQMSGNLQEGFYAWVGDPSKLILANNVIRTTLTDFSDGVSLISGSSTADAFDASIFNNTVVGFDTGIFANGSGIGGRMSGNLLAYNITQAIHLQSAVLPEDHTLFYANGGPAPTLGAGSMVADPKFRRGVADLRLSAGSPAIDAADSTALATLLTDVSIPQIDADGLRRFKGASSLADIGAFEYGDSALIASVTAANGGLIDSTALNGSSGARPQLTQDLNPDSYAAPAYHAGMTGMYYNGSRFGIAAESNGGTPTAGSAYNVFAPAPGNGVLLHTSAAGNVSGFTTEIDDAYLNGQQNRIVLATHRAAPLFNHPFGLYYGFGHWFIIQLDAQTGDPDFPAGVDFHLYAQDPSLNAFAMTAPASATSVVIDHPLLNDEPCGRVYVTDGNLDPHPIEVRFEQDRWRIANVDGSTIPAGANFDVVVDEAATGFCRYDHIFHDGF